MEQRKQSAAASPRLRAKLAIALSLALLLLTAACGSSGERSKYWNLGADGWRYTDTLTFTVADSIPSPKATTANGGSLNGEAQSAGDADSIVRADVAVVVRHSPDYEYSNLWVELSYSTPTDTACVDTFNIVLADDFGRWRGHGIGVGLQLTDTLLRAMPLRRNSSVSLRHIMRADTLQGIEQAGIVIINR